VIPRVIDIDFSGFNTNVRSFIHPFNQTILFFFCTMHDLILATMTVDCVLDEMTKHGPSGT